MEWENIETAPKTGVVILANDTSSGCPWAAAKWLQCDEWEGWIYDDEVMSDTYPLGPNPTHWLPLPSLECWEPIETAPKDGTVVLVNDTVTDGGSTAAKWVQCDEWAGWRYDDMAMEDHNPLGPQPTHWLPLPQVPAV